MEFVCYADTTNYHFTHFCNTRDKNPCGDSKCTLAHTHTPYRREPDNFICYENNNLIFCHPENGSWGVENKWKLPSSLPHFSVGGAVLGSCCQGITNVVIYLLRKINRISSLPGLGINWTLNAPNSSNWNHGKAQSARYFSALAISAFIHAVRETAKASKHQTLTRARARIVCTNFRVLCYKFDLIM